MSAVVSDSSPLNYLAWLPDFDLLLVGSVHVKLDELRSHGFRLSNRHYEQILKDLGEI